MYSIRALLNLQSQSAKRIRQTNPLHNRVFARTVEPALKSGFALCYPQPHALPVISRRYCRLAVLHESSQNRVYCCNRIFMTGQQLGYCPFNFVAHIACAHRALGFHQYSAAGRCNTSLARTSAPIYEI